MLKPIRQSRSKSALYLIFVLLLLADASLPATNTWDNLADTWVATDALGRRVPTFPEVPAPRTDRTVGIFYFLWHGGACSGRAV